MRETIFNMTRLGKELEQRVLGVDTMLDATQKEAAAHYIARYFFEYDREGLKQQVRTPLKLQEWKAEHLDEVNRIGEELAFTVPSESVVLPEWWEYDGEFGFDKGVHYYNLEVNDDTMSETGDNEIEITVAMDAIPEEAILELLFAGMEGNYADDSDPDDYPYSGLFWEGTDADENDFRIAFIPDDFSVTEGTDRDTLTIHDTVNRSSDALTAMAANQTAAAAQVGPVAPITLDRIRFALEAHGGTGYSLGWDNSFNGVNGDHGDIGENIIN